LAYEGLLRHGKKGKGNSGRNLQKPENIKRKRVRQGRKKQNSCSGVTEE